MSLQLAEKVSAKLRIALTGPSNGGKTYSALRLAKGIVTELNPGFSDKELWEEKIACADTERGRLKFYVGRTDLPMATGQFLYQEIIAPYHPQKAIDFINEASKKVGPSGIIIIDSISHFWNYQGGILDIKEEMAKEAGKTSYTAWNEAGQLQNKWLNTLLSADCHVIVTMRSKMDYVLELNDKGKMAPKKVGLAPIQRDDTEYEFDVTLMLDKDHNATIIKDTTFLNQIPFTGIITEDLGANLANWIVSGTDPQKFKEKERLNNIAEIIAMGKEHEPLITFYKTLQNNKNPHALTLEETRETLQKFKEVLK